MPAGNPNALSLGRQIIEPAVFRPDTDPAVIEALSNTQQTIVGWGWPCPAHDGDTQYLGVYARLVGSEHVLYGGNPSDPLNPTVLTIVPTGSASIDFQEEGVSVVVANTVNFVGASVTVTDVGGVATVTITPTGVTAGTYIDISGTDINVDLTEVASYNAANDQFLANNNGTFEWIDTSTIAGTTYTAGTYLDLSGTTFNVDLTEVASYDAGDDQFLHNDNGTLKWTDTSTLGGGGGGSSPDHAIILGQAVGAVDHDDGTFTIDNVTTFINEALAPASSPVTIINLLEFDISDNGWVFAIGSDADGWTVLQAQCPT